MKKIVENIVIVVLIAVISLMSVLLLSYNEYHVSQFGNKSLLIANSDLLNYKKGSLLVVKMVNGYDIDENDYVFYCDTTSNDVITVLSKVKSVIKNKDDYKVILTNGIEVDSKYILGTNKSTKEYKNIGSVLKIFESKIGNLVLIVIPAFLLFIYELVNVILEYKRKE